MIVRNGVKLGSIIRDDDETAVVAQVEPGPAAEVKPDPDSEADTQAEQAPAEQADDDATADEKPARRRTTRKEG